MSRQLYADLPAELHEADEILKRYGRWAEDRSKAQRCGSAERAYRPPPTWIEEDGRSLVAPPSLLPEQLVAAQRALAKTPDRERIVLQILYVPQRIPAYRLLAIARIPPRLSQQRHLAGLRMFDNIYRICLNART